MKSDMIKYLYEFIGTFFLVLTVGMTVINPNGGVAWAPLAIGLILAGMAYAGGYVSGGHYNPAVSLAIFVHKKLSVNNLFGYWIAQIIGASLAAWTVLYLKGTTEAAALQLDPIKALLAEFLFTFALCFVVLNTATTKETNENSYFGLAIGFTVFAGAYAVGTISGGAFNPAVALGISIMKLSQWANLWIYLVAGAAAALTAALVVNAAHENTTKN